MAEVVAQATVSEKSSNTYIHKVYSGFKHITAHHQSKLALKAFLYCQYDQAIRPRVDLLILLKPKIFFRGKMTLVDWNNHDNRLDNNNQI